MWSDTLEKLDPYQALKEAAEERREVEKEKPWNRRTTDESNT